MFRNRIYKGGGSGGGRWVSVGKVGGGTQPLPLKGRNCGAPIVEVNEKMKQLVEARALSSWRSRNPSRSETQRRKGEGTNPSRAKLGKRKGGS